MSEFAASKDTAFSAKFRESMPTSVKVLEPQGPTAELYLAEMANIWNRDLSKRRPLLIVQPTTTEDVQAIVRVYASFDASMRPAFCVSGGRHSANCFRDGSLTLDLSTFKKVEVDATASTVTVWGGVKLGQMDAELSKHGLCAVTGTNPDTGVIGLSIVGGAGYVARKHGFAVDNFVSADVVLANGDLVSCDESNNSDLFWGIRGGAGHFGIVTRLTMRAHKLKNVAVVEHPTFVRKPVPQTTEMLQRFDSWVGTVPDEVAAFCIIPAKAPVNVVFATSIDTSVVPQEPLKNGKSISCTKGAVGQAVYGKNKLTFKDVPGLSALEKDLLGGSFRIGGKSMKIMDYSMGLQRYLVPHQQPGHYYEAAFLLPEMTPEAASILARLAKVEAPNSQCSFIIFAFGGATANFPDESTALESRAYKYWVIMEGQWAFHKDPAVNDKRRQETKDWVNKTRQELSGCGLKESAHVFEGEQDAGFGRRAFADSNLDKLQSLKAKYDPTNVFCFNKVLAPGNAHDNMTAAEEKKEG